jgi:hypothetical protein
MRTPERGLPAVSFPQGRPFAFTIIDDTDDSTVESVAPVYDLLEKLEMRTTKTVWVYPSRDVYTGGSIADPAYCEWVRGLHARGFEIALHGVGSGSFVREEILRGLEIFRETFGDYPKIHVNHADNPDNLYCTPRDRLVWPFGAAYLLVSLVRQLARRRRRSYSGERPDSPHFWGDAASQHIKYIRNLTFNGINTRAYDPRMPYRLPAQPYANYWFSSSDGHTVEEFAELLAPQNVSRLEQERGACIAYTHFASGFTAGGRVHGLVEERLSDLARRGGWFVPAGELLDHLLEANGGAAEPCYGYLARLALMWFWDRTAKYLRHGK